MPPGKSQSAPDTDALYESAVKALARRARSSGQMRELLRKRKGGKSEIEAVVQRLKENGYLDDARFARFFVAARLENDLHGPARVRRDLAARRVKPEIAEAALQRGYQAVDEGLLLRDYLRRKVRLSRPLNKPSAVAALYRRLLRAGFRSDTIVRELKGLLGGSLYQAPAATEPVRWDELLDSLPETPDPESEPRA